ncbi:hypothetical protein NDU88_004096 [Pleurodeles waltl]|uniref:Uncharacterized protein n=1 Tax=Pleurodeles waltl TaxID=8319 RepID=A0AAV7QHD8_PLEWA|nr:hypothetical protein NDU88_004096 [Pleurodeles waltl]
MKKPPSCTHPRSTPAGEPKAHLPCILGNNSIPRRKTGKRPTACGLRKALSCPAGRETLQADCHRWKEDKGPKPTESQGKDSAPAGTCNLPPYQGVPEDNTLENKGLTKNQQPESKWRHHHSKPSRLQVNAG